MSTDEKTYAIEPGHVVIFREKSLPDCVRVIRVTYVDSRTSDFSGTMVGNPAYHYNYTIEEIDYDSFWIVAEKDETVVYPDFLSDNAQDSATPDQALRVFNVLNEGKIEAGTSRTEIVDEDEGHYVIIYKPRNRKLRFAFGSTDDQVYIKIETPNGRSVTFGINYPVGSVPPNIPKFEFDVDPGYHDIKNHEMIKSFANGLLELVKESG